MQHTRRTRVAALTLVALALSSAVLGAPRIQFELVTEPGFPPAGTREWLRLFTQLDGTSIRIRTSGGEERESVRALGNEQTPNYHVVGVLTRRNRLRLLGAPEFTLRDRADIAKWIDELRSDGIPGQREPRVAFGLTSEELVAFHKGFAEPLDFPTKGARAGDVARRIVRQLSVPFEVTADARRAFARNEAVLDELEGLSGGTALAAILGPLGLAAAPRPQSGTIQLLIADARQLDESWPIGWPSEDPPFKVVPALFEKLKVEIKDVPVQTAIDAIQPRIEIPFLLDHNSMARHRVDPATTSVSFPKRESSYMRILSNVLYQAGLRSEIRIDEAGSPFLWISTLKK